MNTLEREEWVKAIQAQGATLIAETVWPSYMVPFVNANFKYRLHLLRQHQH